MHLIAYKLIKPSAQFTYFIWRINCYTFGKVSSPSAIFLRILTVLLIGLTMNFLVNMYIASDTTPIYITPVIAVVRYSPTSKLITAIIAVMNAILSGIILDNP